MDRARKILVILIVILMIVMSILPFAAAFRR